MKIPLPLGNRVLWGAAVICLVTAVWQFKFKPQYRPVYQQGVSDYRNGEYAKALAELQRAYEIDPNAADVVMMLGWTQFKLQHMEEATYYFHRALQLQPKNREARMGAAFVALRTGKDPVITPASLRTLLEQRGSDPDLEILLAHELARAGRYTEAVAYFQRLRASQSYGDEATTALQEILGLQGFDDDVSGLAPAARRADLQVRFRAADRSMWHLQRGSWERFYVRGVNLGPGAPGHSPGEPPQDGRTYSEWLRAVDQLGANVVRVYTLLPPAFYRAFAHGIDAGSNAQLYQQIWVGDPSGQNLYDAAFVEECHREIRYVVDALHGRGEVPTKVARGSGLYTLDVSSRVGAILFGRELEPSVVTRTNQLNASKTSYKGRFISVPNGSPAEVWAAEMLDYVVAYETDTYNWQHPVAFVNWPPLDPLSHPTEASVAEEVRFRRARGEPVAVPSTLQDDNDSVGFDESHFEAQPNFTAGIFASYHIYPYYPDFLLLDPKYLRARDAQGINPMFGYLQDLRAHIPHPLVITEYGIPSSIGISHFHPFGFHHGGHSEESQAEILLRMTRSIRDAGCAGGIAFELLDEWYKQNWLTADFDGPEERRPLWLNELDPEKRYGLIGFRTTKSNLFAGGNTAWQQERAVYTAPAEKRGRLRSLQVAADEAFLYLRLNLDCHDCGLHRDRNTPAHRTYAIALNTLPGQAGIARLPFGNIHLASGADFLLVLDSSSSSRLLVADNYNPYEIRPRTRAGNETAIGYRPGFMPAVQAQGSFVDLVVETNRDRFGRDGTLFPGQRYSRSSLRYGVGDPAAQAYDSRAEWYVDSDGAILVRLPWGKLLVTDPSRREVFFGFQGPAQVRSTISQGIEFSVFELNDHGKNDDPHSWTVVDSLPALADAVIRTDTSRFTWSAWDHVAPNRYFKKAFYALQQNFLAETRTARRSLDRNRRARGRSTFDHGGAAGQ